MHGCKKSFEKLLKKILQRIEAEDKTRIEMRRVKLEMHGCKKSVEKLLENMNATETNFHELRM